MGEHNIVKIKNQIEISIWLGSELILFNVGYSSRQSKMNIDISVRIEMNRINWNNSIFKIYFKIYVLYLLWRNYFSLTMNFGMF